MTGGRAQSIGRRGKVEQVRSSSVSGDREGAVEMWEHSREGAALMELTALPDPASKKYPLVSSLIVSYLMV